MILFNDINNLIDLNM